MRIKPLPKSWLIHTISYEAYTGKKDDFQNPIYDKPVTVKHVRYDNSTVFSRDNTQTKVLAEGIIFVDAVNSNPVPEFKEQSKITFNDRCLTLKKVVPCYYPEKNAVRHYELEVI